ncbi:MAG: hypothetical protein L6R40_005682 [Gallowayella cf. fulva]|nr:MAG: hypothetical protein L6R40_005682 [Xanthomendoza cf. fulva]
MDWPVMLEFLAAAMNIIKVGLQHHELLDCVTDLDRTYHILQHSFVLSSLDSLWGKGGTLNRDQAEWRLPALSDLASPRDISSTAGLPNVSLSMTVRLAWLTRGFGDRVGHRASMRTDAGDRRGQQEYTTIWIRIEGRQCFAKQMQISLAIDGPTLDMRLSIKVAESRHLGPALRSLSSAMNILAFNRRTDRVGNEDIKTSQAIDTFLHGILTVGQYALILRRRLFS